MPIPFLGAIYPTIRRRGTYRPTTAPTCHHIDRPVCRSRDYRYGRVPVLFHYRLPV